MTTARDRPPEEAAEDTSLARGLRLLLAVADRGEVRADDLATLLDMPMSTVYRYLRTLTGFGFVDRRGGTYTLGPRLLIGSGSTVTSEELITLADPVLRLLVGETGETAVVVRRVGLSAVVLRTVDGPRPLRVTLDAGSTWPLHAGSIGTVLLAFAPPEIVDEVLGSGFAPTPRVATEAEARALLRAVETDREDVSAGEIVPGTVCVAVPVIGPDGIVGGLGVIGPEARCGTRWRARTRRLLGEGAGRLERAMVARTPADSR